MSSAVPIFFISHFLSRCSPPLLSASAEITPSFNYSNPTFSIQNLPSRSSISTHISIRGAVGRTRAHHARHLPRRVPRRPLVKYERARRHPVQDDRASRHRRSFSSLLHTRIPLQSEADLTEDESSGSRSSRPTTSTISALTR